MDNFNARIKQARIQAGMSLDDVFYEVRSQLPAVMHVSRATLGRLEKDVPETKADPFLVQFLCTLYGIPVADVSPSTAEALSHYATIIDVRDGDTSDLGNSPSTWNERVGSSGLALAAI